MKRLLLFAALLAWSGMASAVVYKWVDAQGKVQYGDRPPDGVKAEVVELLVSHYNAAPARAAQAPASTSDGKPAPTDAAEKAKVAQDVQQTRDQQCTDAQARYKKLIESRRLYKEGANGERQYLNSDQIDQERLNAKREVDETCNGAS